MQATATAMPQHDVEVEIPVEQIFLDDRYGREPRPGLVAFIAENWDRDAVGVIYVSRRSPGQYACLDGWHRVCAARKVGERTLPARVYVDKSHQQEARLWDYFNRHRKAPKLNEVFKARLDYGEEVAVAIASVVESSGLTIAFDTSRHQGHIGAVGGLERIYVLYGPRVLREALHILKDAWGPVPGSFPYSAITGLGAFLPRYRKLDKVRVVQVLAGLGSKGMHLKARQMGSAITSMAPAKAWGCALREVYNKGLRSGRLPDWPAFTEEDLKRRGRSLAERQAQRKNPEEVPTA